VRLIQVIVISLLIFKELSDSAILKLGQKILENSKDHSKINNLLENL